MQDQVMFLMSIYVKAAYIGNEQNDECVKKGGHGFGQFGALDHLKVGQQEKLWTPCRTDTKISNFHH